MCYNKFIKLHGLLCTEYFVYLLNEYNVFQIIFTYYPSHHKHDNAYVIAIMQQSTLTIFIELLKEI